MVTIALGLAILISLSMGGITAAALTNFLIRLTFALIFLLAVVVYRYRLSQLKDS